MIINQGIKIAAATETQRQRREAGLGMIINQE